MPKLSPKPSFGARKILTLSAHAADEIRTNNRGVTHRSRLIVHLHLPVLTGVGRGEIRRGTATERPGAADAVCCTPRFPSSLFGVKEDCILLHGNANLRSYDTTSQIADG